MIAHRTPQVWHHYDVVVIARLKLMHEIVFDLIDGAKGMPQIVGLGVATLFMSKSFDLPIDHGDRTLVPVDCIAGRSTFAFYGVPHLAQL